MSEQQTSWTTDELERIGSAEEIELASRRSDGSLRPYVTIWGARLGDEIYVRSAYGPDNGWFVRASRSGDGRVRGVGVERDVRFEKPGPEVANELSRAYREKYTRHSEAVVRTVVSSVAEDCTLRLVPR